ncbi:1-deoxy-D-xylulose-5-phosphate synthase family protein [Mycobacterium xenopi 4042]|uniref:1-deoxy-D-xylulose-5-phosphate synthase family protein n=1 Tax=Mycobacterium xenopi 4042 TaxID=1299334 RepID=X8EYD9_MYCXE|nr:1-deoxy-D-xylulose-5-phosphate synthase family protein [Mycobacterium xenopi 4042]
MGDGALTGGMCWEALNNIAAQPRHPIVIVINDNGRSYDPTTGRWPSIWPTCGCAPTTSGTSR